MPGVMGCLAEQFEAQGHKLKAFAERYTVYRQRKKEIEADPASAWSPSLWMTRPSPTIFRSKFGGHKRW